MQVKSVGKEKLAELMPLKIQRSSAEHISSNQSPLGQTEESKEAQGKEALIDYHHFIYLTM